MDNQREVAPYKKKSKTASNSNSSKRADHKHDYEKVVLKSIFGWRWGRRCKVCGRIDSAPYNFSTNGRDDFLKPEAIGRPGVSIRSFLNAEEIKEKYPGIRIFEYDETTQHGWMTYKEVT